MSPTLSIKNLQKHQGFIITTTVKPFYGTTTRGSGLNRLIKYFNHPRACGDFSDFEGDYIILTPNNNNFKVVQEGYSLYGRWFKLRIIN